MNSTYIVIARPICTLLACILYNMCDMLFTDLHMVHISDESVHLLRY